MGGQSRFRYSPFHFLRLSLFHLTLHFIVISPSANFETRLTTSQPQRLVNTQDNTESRPSPNELCRKSHSFLMKSSHICDKACTFLNSCKKCKSCHISKVSNVCRPSEWTVDCERLVINAFTKKPRESNIRDELNLENRTFVGSTLTLK